jgi:uncharacterized protein (TIGR02001 family)
MKPMKKVMTGAVTAAVLATGGLASTAYAEGELSASAAVSNMYLWRGVDLGTGDAAVSGDLMYTTDFGLYGGIWASSGDSAAGQEYDLFVGYAHDFDGGWGIDVSLWNYNYSNTGDRDAMSLNDLTELIVAVSLNNFTFTYYDNVASEDSFESPVLNGEGYNYYTFGYSWDKYSILLGHADPDEKSGVEDYDYTHLDLTYQYNDNLSFTLSKVVDVPDVCDGNGEALVTAGCDDDAIVQLTYSLDIK